MTRLSDQLVGLSQRVSALEAEDFEEGSGIARITKVYGNVRVSAVIRVRVRTSLTPSTGLYPGDDLHDQIYIEG
jgi:hypothetical protein